MGQRAEELRQEIADTRDDLGVTLDAIGDRVSPGRMMDRRKERVRSRFSDVRERVMGSADTISTRVGEMVPSSGGGMSGSGMTEAVTGMAGSARDALRDAPQLGRQSAQGNPLLAGALAFGFGFLVASVLPKSDTEQEAANRMAENLQPMKDTLTEVGQQVASVAKESAAQIAEQAKEEASEAAQQVKESASQAAEQVKSDAQSATQTVKEQASSEAETVKSNAPI